MLYRVDLNAGELPALVSAFMETYEVVAPVKRGRSYAFQVIESFERDRARLSHDHRVAQEVLPAAERDAAGIRRVRQPGDGLRGRDHAPRHLRRARVRHQRAQPAGPGVQGRPLPGPLLRARAAAPRSSVGDELHCPPRTCFCHLWDADEARLRLRPVPAGHRRRVPRQHLERRGGEHPGGGLRPARGDGPRTASSFRHATQAPPGARFDPDIPDIQDVAMLTDAFHKDAVLGRAGRHGAFPARRAPAVCPTCFCFDIAGPCLRP